MASFSIDTKLFRELGELLVGRESTALIELIKNSYDADSTRVEIIGENLDDPDVGTIVVADNGIGMSRDEFATGFLRIAGRSKATAERRSPYYQRRFTGEKGVGRLAAHKLARRVEVRSARWDGGRHNATVGFAANEELRASIDWDIIESLETFAEIEKSNAVKVRSRSVSDGVAGTRLTLAPLRKAWTETDRRNFIDEVSTLTPPTEIIDAISAATAQDPPLLERLQIQDSVDNATFSIEFGGELSLDESELPAPADSADWLVEVDCNKKTRVLSITITPTVRTREKYDGASQFSTSRKVEKSAPIVGFQARIFQKEGVWPKRFRGVRVYHEGFRVLPYGDVRDDWLELDHEYRRRDKGELGRLHKRSGWRFPDALDSLERLAVQGNAAFFGAVLLTREGASELKMLVNREGFLPSPQFDFIADTVRLAIDLQVRIRRAATLEIKRARRQNPSGQQYAAGQVGSSQSPTSVVLGEHQRKALDSLKGMRAAVDAGRSREALIHLSNIEDELNAAAEIGDEAASEATMFRVTASLGLEHAAFVHEVRSLSLSAQSLASTLEKLAKQSTQRQVSVQLRRAAADARELRERLRRNAVYLTDVTGFEGRRRRSRLNLRERIERVVDFYRFAIEERNIELQIDISDKFLTPPMFPAEISAIFGNILSNAVKFAGVGGRVLVAAEQDQVSLTLRIENTGISVDLAASDKFFDAFESTTEFVDESLGHGMGLGLTITRSLLDEYGGKISFVVPSPNYATAIQIELPQK